MRAIIGTIIAILGFYLLKKSDDGDYRYGKDNGHLILGGVILISIGATIALTN